MELGKESPVINQGLVRGFICDYADYLSKNRLRSNACPLRFTANVLGFDPARNHDPKETHQTINKLGLIAIQAAVSQVEYNVPMGIDDFSILVETLVSSHPRLQSRTEYRSEGEKDFLVFAPLPREKGIEENVYWSSLLFFARFMHETFTAVGNYYASLKRPYTDVFIPHSRKASLLPGTHCMAGLLFDPEKGLRRVYLNRLLSITIDKDAAVAKLENGDSLFLLPSAGNPYHCSTHHERDLEHIARIVWKHLDTIDEGNVL